MLGGDLLDFVKKQNETIHIGSDFMRAYHVSDDMDISHATCECKLRTQTGKLLAIAETEIVENTIYVRFDKDTTLTIPRNCLKGKYDIFLTINSYTFKLVMGDVKIIHDVSMH